MVWLCLNTTIISTIVGYLMPNPLYTCILNTYDLVLIGFSGISTIVGYLMLNPLYTYLLNIYIYIYKWKERYFNYRFTFSHEHLKHHTALSKQFWCLKNKGLTPEIEWSILKKSNTPNNVLRRETLYFNT